MEDAQKVGSVAMAFMDELEKNLPGDARVVAVGIVAEVVYTCENCDKEHTITPCATNVESEIHATALFDAGSYCVGDDWPAEVGAEGSE